MKCMKFEAKTFMGNARRNVYSIRVCLFPNTHHVRVDTHCPRHALLPELSHVCVCVWGKKGGVYRETTKLLATYAEVRLTPSSFRWICKSGVETSRRCSNARRRSKRREIRLRRRNVDSGEGDRCFRVLWTRIGPLIRNVNTREYELFPGMRHVSRWKTFRI